MPKLTIVVSLPGKISLGTCRRKLQCCILVKIFLAAEKVCKPHSNSEVVRFVNGCHVGLSAGVFVPDKKSFG